MARQGIPAIILSLGLAATAVAQPASGMRKLDDIMSSAVPSAAPTYKYPVVPEAGPWLICVQTFKGPDSQRMAEALADCLNRDFKIPAYLQDSGRKQREEEKARVEKLRAQYRAQYEEMERQGLKTPDGMRRWRVPDVQIDDEFAVLVGKRNRQLKDMEAARDYLDEIRKLKDLPKEFQWKALFEFDKDKKDRTVKSAEVFVNPFVTAMVVHNPTVSFEKQQDDPTVATKFLKELNSDEEYSVLKCRKNWTLVVKVYQAPSAILGSQNGPTTSTKFSPTKKDGESYLNIGAMNAHLTAEFLRKAMKQEAYVMHHSSYSVVTVGQYDSPEDPQLLANQKTMAGMQLRDGNGDVKASFSAQPLPMRIPK